MSSVRARESCSALPAGWTREAVRRQGGVSSGKLDVYYISPAGKKIRSKPELIREVGDTCDLSGFDYQTGKMGSSLIKPGRSRKLVKKPATDVMESSNLNNLTAPIRQTASIFKQPVTVYKSNQTQVKKDIKSEKDKPRQLFWERRLSNISPNHTGDEALEMSLPTIIKEVECLGRSSTSTLLASISTALHLQKKPVTGQVRGMLVSRISTS